MTELALNAIATLDLAGLFDSRSSQSPRSNLPSTRLQRKDAPQDLVKPLYRPITTENSRKYYTETLPERRPSKLPPPGNGNLRASIGRHLGHGRSGVVYALEDVKVSGLPSDIVVPPLVVKIARMNRVTSLMREAWFYDEIECVQGAVAARCYGWFEAEIGEMLEVGKRPKVFDRYPSYEAGAHDELLDMELQLGPLHPLMEERRRRRDVIAVLVLERLGSKLPPGKPVSPETREDIIGLYDELGTLGLNLCQDIRWQNILAAPLSPPGLPSLPSPITNRVHQWRVIDLEMSRKCNFTLGYLDMKYVPEIVGGVFCPVEENDRSIIYESDNDDWDGEGENSEEILKLLSIIQGRELRTAVMYSTGIEME